ncbi:hypothetical protein GGR54DRAFT_330796 [Hypoxylon sp. NC1633]|nr:hypothetical protein GGR54DRAFT_330796 [Hypoxylon sp. NC1633]
MSSPTPTNDRDAPSSNLEQITFRFCSECSNMLYPKEDEDAHKLQFTCRTCQFTEEATSSCVFRNVINSAAGETAGVTQDVGSDPTVRNNVSFSNPSSSSTQSSSSAATDLAICLRCGVTLLHCDRCKDPASVEEYNQCLTQNPEYAVTRVLDIVRSANCWNAQDDEEQASLADRFAMIGDVTIPVPSQDYRSTGVSSPFDNPFLPADADPPEALEDPPEDQYGDMSM